jgi:hypothetical protein
MTRRPALNDTGQRVGSVATQSRSLALDVKFITILVFPMLAIALAVVVVAGMAGLK